MRRYVIMAYIMKSKGNKGQPQTLPSRIHTRKLKRVLRKCGAYKKDRHPKGSHEIWERKADGRVYSAPVVLRSQIPIGILKSILRLLNINEKEFIKYLGIVLVIIAQTETIKAVFVLEKAGLEQE